jgi:AcrR family transcriptional regulator
MHTFDMKRRPRRRYDASGRQAAAGLTREAIVAAAMTLLRTVRPDQLAYADVADAAGIALRTVYRHFPNVEDLLGAVLSSFLAELEAPTSVDDISLADLVERFETYHAKLSTEPGLYRLFFVLPARAGSGMAAIVERICRDALARIPAEHHAAVRAAVELQLSPYAWEVFHTHWSVPPARITRTVLLGVQLLLDGFVANPRALSTSAPLPPLFRDRPSRSSTSKGEAS